MTDEERAALAHEKWLLENALEPAQFQYVVSVIGNEIYKVTGLYGEGDLEVLKQQQLLSRSTIKKTNIN